MDWLASFRACGQLVFHRRIISGGSTITQQLIKLSQPRPRTFATKIIEALQALRLEQVWTKQQILAAYLNRVEYGNFNRGCSVAADFYFHKPLHDLSPAECALLAGLPQAPSRLNPLSHYDRAVKRQRWVLGQMYRHGWLTDEQLSRALAEPLRIDPRQRVFECPHFIDLLLASNAALATGTNHSTLRTTLDLRLTHFVEERLRERLSPLKPQRVSDGAVVVIDNRTGDLLALVGSQDYFSPNGGQVNGAWAPRSPGSALKPFTYWLALEHGDTPATVVADVPTEFATATGIFAPVNYNRRCYGPMRYRQALANSLNISAVKVLASVGGPEPLQQRLRECGVSTLTRPAESYGLGLTIGNAEVRLLELANAYSCLARLGVYKPWRTMLDHEREAPSPANQMVPEQIGDPSAAYLIADILSDNEARALAFGADSSLRFDFPVACKTGTSSDFRDNWAFGYTPEFTVGVWVGNFDGSPMEDVSGITGAGPIMHDVMEHLHTQFGTTWYAPPTNITTCFINPLTGKRPEPSGSTRAVESLREKFTTKNLPAFESAADYAGSPPKVLLGSEYREWFSSADNWLGDRAIIGRLAESLRITFPLPGTTLYLDADLPIESHQLTLRASGPTNLLWQSPSLELKEKGNAHIALLTEGRHELSVRDVVTGKEARTWIEVLTR